MHAIARPIIDEAEALAAGGAGFIGVLSTLRKLSMEDFGSFMISLPNTAYPSLSSVMPPMASAEVQNHWTGSSGLTLFKQTAAFMRLVENNFVRYVNRPLRDATILDFGCGYGRFVRMLYYYKNPDTIWAVDAWGGSLEESRKCRLPGNFRLSQVEPDSLPVDEAKFDLAFAFSVFTHLSPTTATTCLAAIRKHMIDGGILIATVRPVEYWPFYDQQHNLDIADGLMKAHHETGIAYRPHQGDGGKNYGDISLKLEFLAQEGWRLEGYDNTSADPYQIAAILRAV